jgi:hypothetical protein
MDKTNKQSSAIRNKLKEMDQVNKQLIKKDPGGNDSKIRVSQVMSIYNVSMVFSLRTFSMLCSNTKGFKKCIKTSIKIACNVKH